MGALRSALVLISAATVTASLSGQAGTIQASSSPLQCTTVDRTAVFELHRPTFNGPTLSGTLNGSSLKVLDPNLQPERQLVVEFLSPHELRSEGLGRMVATVDLTSPRIPVLGRRLAGTTISRIAAIELELDLSFYQLRDDGSALYSAEVRYLRTNGETRTEEADCVLPVPHHRLPTRP